MTVYTEPVRQDFWQLARNASGDYIDPLGPRNCMTHTAARMVMRATEGKKPANAVSWPPNGYDIRRHCLDPETGRVDTTGGVFHSQVQAAVRRMYGVQLTIYNGNSFDDAVDLADASSTRGLSMSIWYRRFRDNAAVRGSFEFYQNHEIYLNFANRLKAIFERGVDPLADGRRTGIAEGPMSYPFSLVKAAAGELNVSGSGYRALGAGRAFFMVTEPTGAPPGTWQAQVHAGTTYTRYTVAVVNGKRKIVGHKNYLARTGFTAPCTHPYDVVRQTISETVQLVKITKPGSPMDGVWIARRFARTLP